MPDEQNKKGNRVKGLIGRYFRLLLGIMILLFGILFMFIPFIPLGYLFIFMSLFFLATFFPPIKRLVDYLKDKDKNGIVDKAERTSRRIEEQLSDKLN